jgi:hypothetical protein
MWTTLWEREKAILADIDANSVSDRRRLRTAADLKALLAVTRRDTHIYAAAVRQYKAGKEAKKQQRKEFWQQMRTAERKTVHSAGLSFPVVVQFGRRS